MDANKQNSDEDEDAKLWLVAGDPVDIDRGLTYIAEKYEHRVCGFLRGQFPGMDINDILDVWGDTLDAVVTAAREQKLAINGTIGSLLCTIARRRATDRLRRRASADEVVSAVSASLEGTETGSRWKKLTGLERSEIRAEIQLAICRLPKRQRITMQAFADGFPDTENMEVLRRDVSQREGAEVTLASVKRALQEARVKVRDALTRRGMGVVERGGR